MVPEELFDGFLVSVFSSSHGSYKLYIPHFLFTHLRWTTGWAQKCRIALTCFPLHRLFPPTTLPFDHIYSSICHLSKSTHLSKPISNITPSVKMGTHAHVHILLYFPIACWTILIVINSHEFSELFPWWPCCALAPFHLNRIISYKPPFPVLFFPFWPLLVPQMLSAHF